jgi:hypothetical protein
MLEAQPLRAGCSVAVRLLTVLITLHCLQRLAQPMVQVTVQQRLIFPTFVVVLLLVKMTWAAPPLTA